MMTDSARAQLHKALKPLLPPSWKIEASSRAVDNVPTTVLQLQQLEIARLPQTQGLLALQFRATITAPQERTQAAEDRLDDDTLTLIRALLAEGILWTRCEKVKVKERLGYDLDITITAERKPQ